MKSLLWTATVLLVQILAPSLNAQPAKTTAEKLDEYLTSAQQAYRFNGALLVAHKGKVLLHKAHGVRNAVTKAPNDTSTRFPILSITKSFTSALILMLQERGKLSVEDKLSKYFPDYPNGNQIKLHHLMTHTSGIFNFTQMIDEGDSAIVCHPVPKERVLELFWNKPLEFTPGKQFSYNNSAYFLLGMIIEKVTGKPYEQAMREMVFQPLGMTHSGFDFINLPAQSRAFGYDTLTADYYSPYPHYDSTVVYSAGSIYSTTSDMYKWGRAVADQQLISPKSWKEAFTPRLNDYGYGWMIGDYSGKRYMRHSGGYPGFMSEFVYYPGEDITIILFNNFGNYDDSLFPLVMGLSAVVMNKPYDLWEPLQQVKLDKAALRQYIGSYVLNDKFGIDIVLKDDRLYAQGKGKTQFSELGLNVSGEDKFFIGAHNTRLTFQKDESGKVVKFTLRELGQDTEWKRLN
ncbi:serine hydrolase [Spirosoma soli]|uniref:Serine hydrolase n=1 Tax=Spirosoma soli TaxID=1770529 RepID=A0ABW5M424_9BACT